MGSVSMKNETYCPYKHNWNSWFNQNKCTPKLSRQIQLIIISPGHPKWRIFRLVTFFGQIGSIKNSGLQLNWNLMKKGKGKINASHLRTTRPLHHKYSIHLGVVCCGDVVCKMF